MLSYLTPSSSDDFVTSIKYPLSLPSQNLEKYSPVKFKISFIISINTPKISLSKLNPDLASTIIFDTTALEPMVKENNLKFIQNQLKKTKSINPDLETSAIYYLIHRINPVNFIYL